MPVYRNIGTCRLCIGVQVEEMVLDYLAWSSDSPLYDAIDAAGSVPSYEDVALPTPTVGGVATPNPLPIHPRVKSLGPFKGEPAVSTVQTFVHVY